MALEKHMNNPLSYSSIKLDLFSKEGSRLKPASGFIVECGTQYYLITNQHVLSGREISAGEQSISTNEPFILKTSVHIHGGEGETGAPLSIGVRKRITIPLYDENNAPIWVEPPADEQD